MSIFLSFSRKIQEKLSSQFKVRLKSGKSAFFRFPFAFSFGVITLLNLWFALRDRTTPYFNGVSATAIPSQAANAWGWSDSGSYLQMGIAQANFGHLTPDLLWTAIFWPPGMSFLNAFAIKMVGLEGQFIFVLATITALLWGLVLALIFNILRSFMRVWIAILVMVALIQTDLYHQYLVRDAIIWSDGYAAAFICLTILFSYFGYSKSSLRFFVLSGFSLAMTAYIRGQYFVVVQFFFVLAVGILGLSLLISVVNKVKKLPDFSRKFSAFLTMSRTPLVVLSLVAVVACAPYLLWQKNHIGDLSWDSKGKWHWTSTDVFAAMSNWNETDDLAGFVREGGGGTACKVDPALCAEVNTAEKKAASPFSVYDSEPYTGKQFYEMTIKTFRQHPLQWFKVKFPYFMKYWDSQPAITNPAKTDFPVSEISAVGLLLFTASFFFRSARRYWFAPAFIALILIGATIGPPYFAHLEVRYLVAVKLIGFTVAIGVAGYVLEYLLRKNQPLLGAARQQ